MLARYNAMDLSMSGPPCVCRKPVSIETAVRIELFFPILDCLAWWRSGYGTGLATPKVAGSTPGLVLSSTNLGKLFIDVPLSPSSITW